MLGEFFSGPTWQALSNGLRALSLRQSVLANNLANAETPGYRRQDVPFVEQLQAYLSQLEEAGSPVAPFQPRVQVVATGPLRRDGNGVDVEAESARLAQNALLYEAAVRQAGEQLAMLRTAIWEGRR